MTHLREQIGIQTPGPVTAIIKRDDVAFRAALLARTNGALSAVGVQCVKTPAHARNDANLEQLVQGLRWARQHRAALVDLQPNTARPRRDRLVDRLPARNVRHRAYSVHLSDVARGF
jgi:hypothetical protein